MPDFKNSPPHPDPLPPFKKLDGGGEGEHGVDPLPPTPPVFRDRLVPEDVSRVRNLVTATGFFYPDEVDVAAELAAEQLQNGDASGYFFIMADGSDGRLLGYACFGPTPCTESSYDLYWIAVLPEAQGSGLGRRLLVEAERRIRTSGGSRVYIETSMRPQYEGTRAFYERCGYGLSAILPDFYAPGDGKGIYCRRLPIRQ